jgi:hypothetical protein
LTVLTTLTLSSRGGWCTPARVWWSLMGSLGVMLIGLLMAASAGLIVTPYVWVGQVVVIVLALVLFYVIQRERWLGHKGGGRLPVCSSVLFASGKVQKYSPTKSAVGNYTRRYVRSAHT